MGSDSSLNDEGQTNRVSRAPDAGDVTAVVHGDESVPGADDIATTWAGPGRFGIPRAFSSVTGVAAPLLAGFSLTLLGVVAQAPASFRFPGLAMVFLILVIIAMVASVQFGFRSQEYLYSRADIVDWLPISEVRGETQEVELARLARVQKRHMKKWAKWAKWTARAYNTGIVLLAFGVTLVAIPPLEYLPGVAVGSLESAARWFGAAVALIAGLLELGGLSVLTVQRRWHRRNL